MSARAVSARSPTGPCGGLADVSLVACKQLTDAGAAALLRGPATRASLARLDVSRCPGISVTGLSGPRAPALAVLRAHSCHGLVGALVLDASSLPSLASLSLAGCGRLRSVRLGPLPRLTHLNVAGCKALAALGLGSVPRLATVSASGCAALATLWPAGAVPGLVELNLFGCRALNAEAVEGALSACVPAGLASLTLNGCAGLARVRLPGPAPALSALDAAGCSSAVEVDASGAPRLASLRLDGCSALTRVRLAPGARLRRLSISGCDALAPEWGALAASLW
jgi:hypothetical protein